MRYRAFYAFGYAISWLSLSTALAGSMPFFTGIGDLPGGEYRSSAFGVSGNGQVVTGVGYVAGGVHAIRWDLHTGMVSLGDAPGGATASAGSELSFDGHIIAGYGTVDHDRVPARWIGNQSIELLNPSQPPEGSCVGVSGDGSTIVGYGDVRGFIWRGAEVTYLGPNTLLQGVSYDGSVVGGYTAAGKPFLWNEASG